MQILLFQLFLIHTLNVCLVLFFYVKDIMSKALIFYKTCSLLCKAQLQTNLIFSRYIFQLVSRVWHTHACLSHHTSTF